MLTWKNYIALFVANIENLKIYIFEKTLQSNPTISNSEGIGQKVRDSAIFEIARLGDSEITPEENSRYWDFQDLLTIGRIGPKKKQGYHEKASKRPKNVWVNEQINIKNIRVWQPRFIFLLGNNS